MPPLTDLKAWFCVPKPGTQTTASDPAQVAGYFRNQVSAGQFAPQIQCIDDATADDLDLDTVFAALDRTSSRVGQQCLYARLRMPCSESEVDKFIRHTDFFAADDRLADSCRKALQRLSSADAYGIQNLIFDAPQPVRRIGMVYLLSLATLLSLAAAFFQPLFLLLFGALFAVNAYLHYSNKIRITTCLSSVAQLRKCIPVARDLANEKRIAARYDTSFLEQTTRIERRSRIIGWQGGEGNDFVMLLWLLLELVKIVCNEEIILYHHFAKTITRQRAVIDRLFRFTGDIDAAIAVATLRRERTICRPQFTTDKRLEIIDGYHPLIEGCTANSLSLDGQSLLLTGSNMSGKTTFIRTVALNALTGQTLGICFAERYTASFFRIFSSIRIADDMEAGESYYLAEVLTIKAFLEAAAGQAPCLFLLDELFKGTNTTERIAAGKAVLAYLNTGKHLVCVATHDTELCTLLNGSYALYHFREEVRQDKLVFDYKLHQGTLSTRNAIRILELYDYPPELVEDAYRTQEHLTASPRPHTES